LTGLPYVAKWYTVGTPPNSESVDLSVGLGAAPGATRRLGETASGFAGAYGWFAAAKPYLPEA